MIEGPILLQLLVVVREFCVDLHSICKRQVVGPAAPLGHADRRPPQLPRRQPCLIACTLEAPQRSLAEARNGPVSLPSMFGSRERGGGCNAVGVISFLPCGHSSQTKLQEKRLYIEFNCTAHFWKVML